MNKRIEKRKCITGIRNEEKKKNSCDSFKLCNPDYHWYSLFIIMKNNKYNTDSIY